MRTNVHSYISSVFKDFNKFNKRNGGRKRYENDTIDSVSTDLIDAKAADVLYLNDYKPSNSHVNDPSAFKDGHNRHRSRSNFSRLKFAPMNVKSQDEVSTSQEQEQQDDEQIECTAEEFEEAKDKAQAYFDSLVDNWTGDKDELFNDLVFTAMREIKAKKCCEICSDTHDVGGCWLRGEDFQPEWLRKRIAQVNLRDGNKPKSPPTDRTIPPRSTLSKNLTYNAMSMSTSLNNQLDTIEKTLKQEVNSNKLSITPKLSSLKLPSQQMVEEQIRGPADAVQIGDYSVYNEQVNC
jgi:hypothetical protein